MNRLFVAQNRFLIERQSKSFCEMLLYLWRYELFVRSLVKTKGHGYINLTTKVPIVRGDQVPGCLLHLTMQLNTMALWAWLHALPDTTTQCCHRVCSSVTTGYRTSNTFIPFLQRQFLHASWSLKYHTMFWASLECDMQSSITTIHWHWV